MNSCVMCGDEAIEGNLVCINCIKKYSEGEE